MVKHDQDVWAETPHAWASQESDVQIVAARAVNPLVPEDGSPLRFKVFWSHFLPHSFSTSLWNVETTTVSYSSTVIVSLLSYARRGRAG